MSNKSRAIIAIAAILMLFAFCRKSRRPKKPSSSSTAESISSKPELASQVSPPGIASSAKNQPSPSQGLSTPPTVGASYYRDNEGRRFLTVNISPKKQCQKGDADAMISIMGSSGAKIIATLEPVKKDKSWKPVIKELVDSNLQDSTDFGFEIKEDSPKAFAILICSDTRGSNSCLGKPPAKLTFGYETFISSLEDTSNRDFVFFAHIVVLNKQNYEVYQSNFDLENIHRTIAASLNTNKLAEPEMRTAAEIANLLRVIRPYPIIAVNDGAPGTVLKIDLTKEDITLCK